MNYLQRFYFVSTLVFMLLIGQWLDLNLVIHSLPSFSSRNSRPWVEEYGCHLSSKQSEVISHLKKKTRHELAAVLEKKPRLSTQFPKRNLPREWQEVAVGHRHAQGSIAIYSAVLCCSVLHGQFCWNENVLVHRLKWLMGCADVLHLLCFFCSFCFYLILFFAMSGYVLNIVISNDEKNNSKCYFQKSWFF